MWLRVQLLRLALWPVIDRKVVLNQESSGKREKDLTITCLAFLMGHGGGQVVTPIEAMGFMYDPSHDRTPGRNMQVFLQRHNR